MGQNGIQCGDRGGDEELVIGEVKVKWEEEKREKDKRVQDK